MGHAADVVIFEPQEVRDTATFTDLLSYCVGIDDVLVNGIAVIAEGTYWVRRSVSPPAETGRSLSASRP